MSALVQAVNSNDIVKFKNIFNESMKKYVNNVIEERKLEIVKSVMTEGEEIIDDEDEDESDKKDESVEDEDDEDEPENKEE